MDEARDELTHTDRRTRRRRSSARFGLGRAGGRRHHTRARVAAGRAPRYAFARARGAAGCRAADPRRSRRRCRRAVPLWRGGAVRGALRGSGGVPRGALAADRRRIPDPGARRGAAGDPARQRPASRSLWQPHPARRLEGAAAAGRRHPGQEPGAVALRDQDCRHLRPHRAVGRNVAREGPRRGERQGAAAPYRRRAA